MNNPRHVAPLSVLFLGPELDPMYRRRLLSADLVMGRDSATRELWVVFGHEALTALRNRAPYGDSESVDILIIEYDRHDIKEQTVVEFAVICTKGLTAVVQDEQFLNQWADS